jgi:hypothetical protein
MLPQISKFWTVLRRAKRGIQYNPTVDRPEESEMIERLQAVHHIPLCALDSKKKPQKRKFRPATNSGSGTSPPVDRNVQLPNRTCRINAQREVSRSNPEHLTFFPADLADRHGHRDAHLNRPGRLQSLRLLAEDAQLATKRSSEGNPSQSEASE